MYAPITNRTNNKSKPPEIRNAVFKSRHRLTDCALEYGTFGN